MVPPKSEYTLHRVGGIIGMARVWRLTAKWGVAFNVNTIDDTMMAFY